MANIGDSLREARIRRGLTIRDAEDATKIRSKYLQALEDNDYEVLPGTTYVKAFLRTYATYLKLDPDELLEEYLRRPESSVEEQGLVRTEAVQYSRTRTAAERKKQRTSRSQRGYAIIGVLAVVVIFLLAWFGSGRGGGGTPPLDGNSFVSATTMVRPQSTETSKATGGPTSTVSGPVTSGKNVTLVINVTEKSCWMVVREDSENGAELYAGTLSAGGQKTFDGAKRYWLNVGRPSVLALTINGNPYTLDAEGDTFIFVVTEAGVERSR